MQPQHKKMVSSLTGTIIQIEQKYDQLQHMVQNNNQMMLDMANMFKSSRQDTLDREQLIRCEITTAINLLSAHVKHLTSTVQVLRE